MGIPRFFYWLYKEYPYTITHLKEKETFLKYKINVDTYALDLNAIVHPICQQIFKYGQNSEKYNSLLHTKKEIYPSKRIECYNKICEKIDELVNIVNPKSKIILALDGTAGMSKQYQQRQRRYKTVLEENNLFLKDFDPNEITTGSIFMNELSQCIEEYISHKIKNDWKDLDIYFSSEQVPGEGEHKILHLLKQYSSFSSYCIHSPDADLIMLSLASLCTHEFKKCYIIRDNIYENVYCKYFVVNVNLFSELIDNKFKMYSKIKKENYFMDFIFYCLFFGNDFLPENPLMLTDKNGIDILFLLYSETILNCGNLTKINNSKIILNLEECIYFFEKLTNNEDLFYKKKFNSELTLEKYKKEYYKNKLNFDVENSEIYNKQVNKLCNEYVKGLQFVMTYYLFEIPDWHWFYPYHYSPFFSDILNYLNNIKQKKQENNLLSFKFIKNEPLTSFEQLLAVLPPESSNILPEPFSKLMTDNESEIKCFYPNNDEIKIEIKNKYEKLILVPFINIKLLKKTFNTIFDQNKINLNENEIERNLFKKTKCYINSNKLKL